MRNGFLAILAVLSAAFAITVKAQEFPQTIEHKFGITVIEQKPERIATLDYAGADDLLALGIQPVAIRYWYGDYPKIVWPWAESLLTTEPVVIRKPIDYELLATAKPDVILALWSGIDQQDYEKLSQIAPVVAVPEGMGDYAMSWDERALTAGKAIGKEEEAREKIDALNQRLTDIAAAHPEWQDKTTAVAYAWKGTPGAYNDSDIRMLILHELGFHLAPALVKQMKESNNENNFVINLSEEQIELLDSDLLIWVSNDNLDVIKSLKGRTFLQAYRDGREIILDRLVSSAFSHGSLLSLPYVIDNLVPQIEAALNSQE